MTESSQTATTHRLLPVLGVGALMLSVAVVYWPGLNGPFILDDVVNLDILRVLDEQGSLSLRSVLAERGGILGGRPVAWASFLMNWYAFGDDVWSYKLVNLALHLVNGVLVLALARVLLLEAAAPSWSSRAKTLGAFAVAAAWLLTPMQVSTVLYVVQRMAMLAACFSLAGLVAYSLGRRSLAHHPRRGGLLVASSILLCWPLATLSKQNGVLLVFLLLIVELVVFSRPGAGVQHRWPRHILFVLCGLTLLAVLLRIALDPGWVTKMYAVRDFGLLERLLTQPRVLSDYTLNILQLPGGSALGLFHDDFGVSRGLIAPPATLINLVLWTTVPVIAFLARRSDYSLIGLGLSFFLVAHALEAGPFGLEIYFEHRNYLPSFGIFLSAVAAAMLLAGRLPRLNMLVAVAIGVTVLGYAGLSVARVNAWTSWEGIVHANARAHPDSPRARVGAAAIAFTSGELERGLAHLDAAVARGGARMHAGAALEALVGYCLSERVPPENAYVRLETLTSLDDDPFTVAGLRWYRSVATGNGCPLADNARVATALSDRIGTFDGSGHYAARWVLHAETARLLEHAGLPDKAARHFERALAGAPTSMHDSLASRLHRLEPALR